MLKILRTILKRMVLLLGLAVLMLLAGQVALAQDFAGPLWQASYWDNMYLSGTPEVQRSEGSINFNWGNDSPDPEIGDDQFSARWTTYMHFNPGTYRFAATGDDGIRVWVDGDLIIDEWYDHQVETFVADKNLSGGPHHIRVEYYENESGAIVQLWWAPAPPPDGNNWRGEYFNNTSLRGEPDLVREDPVIGFNWTDVSPGPGISEDNFSARWTQTVNLPAGTYRFLMTVDDGGRLWVNGRQVINAWRIQEPTTYQGEAYVPGGPVPIRVEYFDNLLGAMIHLSWERQEPLMTDVWRGEYYAGTQLAGEPVLVRNEPRVNYNWGTGSPAPNQVGTDYFSARWTRTINPPAGTYRFMMTVDDGGRLWVDDRLVIDAWQVQSPQTYTGDVYLAGNPVQARMEYFESTGQALAQLSWDQVAPPFQTGVDGWRGTIPPQYHAEFQACLDYLNRVGLELGPAPNWNLLLGQCRSVAEIPQP